jgi:hypothetical protein
MTPLPRLIKIFAANISIVFRSKGAGYMLNPAETTLGESKAVPLARQFLTIRYSELSVPVSPAGYHQVHESLNFLMEELKLLLALTPEHRAKISERIPPGSKAKNRGESQAVHEGLKEFEDRERTPSLVIPDVVMRPSSLSLSDKQRGVSAAG